MLYSFIAPRPKRVLGNEVRLVLIFFATISTVLLALYGFFLYQNKELQSEMQALQVQYTEIAEQNEMLIDDIEFIEEQAAFTESIVTGNTIIKEQIKNFMDLVPDEIVLHKVVLSNGTLILEGSTTDRSSFQNKLQLPLNSMFHETNVTYSTQEDTTLHFISRSTVQKESGP